MAFDDTHHSGGGGGDGHKEPSQDVIEACTAAAVMTAKLQGTCMGCTMLETGIYIVARSLVAHALGIKGDTDIPDAQKLDVTQDFVRGVMQEIADQFSDRLAQVIDEQEGRAHDQH